MGVLECSSFPITVGRFGVIYFLCESVCVCVLFFASNIDDMKRTINSMVGVQLLLSHACRIVCPCHHFFVLEKVCYLHRFLPNDSASQTHPSPASTSFSTPSGFFSQPVARGVCAQMDNLSKLCYCFHDGFSFHVRRKRKNQPHRWGTRESAAASLQSKE